MKTVLQKRQILIQQSVDGGVKQRKSVAEGVKMVGREKRRGVGKKENGRRNTDNLTSQSEVIKPVQTTIFNLLTSKLVGDLLILVTQHLLRQHAVTSYLYVSLRWDHPWQMDSETMHACRMFDNWPTQGILTYRRRAVVQCQSRSRRRWWPCSCTAHARQPLTAAWSGQTQRQHRLPHDLFRPPVCRPIHSQSQTSST